MLSVLDSLVYVLGTLSLIALPFLAINWFRYLKVRATNRSRFVPQPEKFPGKSVTFFSAPTLLAIFIAQVVTSHCRTEAQNFLRDLSGDYEIYLNSQPVQDPHRVAAALKELAPEWGHHSHPTKMIRIEIHSNKGSLALELGRDSAIAQEYWVFYPKYRVTSNNEIGRITTSVFDEQ